ncbi:hypothetical protein AVEN_217410-1 [Araneus ventricosus]|uniref:Uncharacterized protein n=1 Tax=Araneus ventricosus TaxID=182803 RepID=A0A4Y2MIA8_ARAVE|nr:hypothetical protein AVEN_217410-1 [Araneus ventricosus]
MLIRGFTSEVKVYHELIPVNPDTIFRKVSLLYRRETLLNTLLYSSELQKYFLFELAPFPLSLFDEGLRKARKSVFSDLFPIETDVRLTSTYYVVASGFLLHPVLWQTTSSFPFILKKYADYAKKNFNEGDKIEFYDYPENALKSTK